MLRATDQEVTAIEKTACYSEFPRNRVGQEGAHGVGGAPGSVRRQREQGEMWAKPLWWFLWEGMHEEG